MARHIPTGQLVAVKQTNLDECTEEELLQLMVSCCPEKDVFAKYAHFNFSRVSVFSNNVSILQNEVLLSRLFRHSNLLTSRLVFSSCCQLWVLTPLMAYGQPLPPQSFFCFCFILSLNHSKATRSWFCEWLEKISGFSC